MGQSLASAMSRDHAIAAVDGKGANPEKLFLIEGDTLR
jgi:hypothetical protein